jgi:hypothetical protein
MQANQFILIQRHILNQMRFSCNAKINFQSYDNESSAFPKQPKSLSIITTSPPSGALQNVTFRFLHTDNLNFKLPHMHITIHVYP